MQNGSWIHQELVSPLTNAKQHESQMIQRMPALSYSTGFISLPQADKYDFRLAGMKPVRKSEKRKSGVGFLRGRKLIAGLSLGPAVRFSGVILIET